MVIDGAITQGISALARSARQGLLVCAWAVVNLALGLGMILPLGFLVTLVSYLPQAGQAHHAYVHVLGRRSPFSFLFDSDEVEISAAFVLVVAVVLLALTVTLNRRLLRAVTSRRRTSWAAVAVLQLVPSVWFWR